MPDQTIVVVDSGFGGLNMAAMLEAEMPASGTGPMLDVQYVNVAPSDARGYNQMETHAEKQRVFGQALTQIDDVFGPNAIYVACNTLSALLPEVMPALHLGAQVHGIVSCGAELLETTLAVDPRAQIILFATETTIDSGIYQTSLANRGVLTGAIVPCPAPGLATLISNDAEGDQVENRIKELFPFCAVTGPEVGLFLGCTHYGFRADRFAAVAKSQDLTARLLDPTAALARQVLQHYPNHRLSAHIPFWGFYAPPQRELATISGLLAQSAPKLARSILSPMILRPMHYASPRSA